MSLDLKTRIRDLREEFGYNQKMIAEQLGISAQAYSHYETGRRVPSGDMLAKLAKIYNVSMAYLLRGIEQDSPDGQMEEILREMNDMDEEEVRSVQNFMGYLKYRKKQKP